MDGIADESHSTDDGSAREMTRLQIVRSRLSILATRLRRKLPYLVWYGDELDVRVTFSQNKLDPENPMRSLFSGALYEVEKQMRDMDINYDTGIGCAGRDWEWDFSLKGPISVTFRSRATRPERRKEPPRPHLIFSRSA